MVDLYNPAFTEEWKQNLDAADYEKNINQDVKIPSIKKQIYCNEKLKTGQQA